MVIELVARFAPAALALIGTQAIAQPILFEARPEIALSVTSKFAQSQRPVEFTVTMPDGKSTTATAAPRNGGQLAGTVRYPGDFGNAGMHVGDYKWSARIDGKVVLTGTFAYRPSEHGQLLFVPR